MPAPQDLTADTEWVSGDRRCPLCRVSEAGVAGNDPAEHLPRSSEVTGLFVEVGEYVGLAKVMNLHALHRAMTTFEKVDGFGKTTTVGQRAGHDDPPFGHQVRRR